MKSFEEFLSEKGDVPEDSWPYYVRWVWMFSSFTAADPELSPGARAEPYRASGIVRGLPGTKLSIPAPPTVEQIRRFLAIVEKWYEAWQIRQARHALQLYSYYLTRMKPRETTPLPNAGAADWGAAESVIMRLMRLQHYSPKTEKSYLFWVRRFRGYVGSKQPRSLTADDLRSFLSHLAVEDKVAAATQKLAFNAVLFLFRNVLSLEVAGLASVVPSHVPRRLPVVLTPDELRKVFAGLEGVYRLMAMLIYGSGLRLQECLSLRTKDIDFARKCITIRCGKGGKDRQTVLPESTLAELTKHLSRVRELFDRDRRSGVEGVVLPGALERKLPGGGQGVALVLGVSRAPALGGPPNARCSTLPSIPHDTSAGLSGRGAGVRHRQARHGSHASSQLCHASDREWIRHSYDPGVDGARGRLHDDDLYPRCFPEQARGRQPGGRTRRIGCRRAPRSAHSLLTHRFGGGLPRLLEGVAGGRNSRSDGHRIVSYEWRFWQLLRFGRDH